MQVSTPYRLLILLAVPVLCSARIRSQDFVAAERELFLVDPTASVGTNVSSTYAEMGYDSDHNSTCIYRIYGTPDNVAAGDRDMLMVATYFKRRFNKLARQQNPETPILMTRTEILSQKLGDTVERRQLSEQDGRELLSEEERKLLFVRYSFGFLITNFVCSACSADNADARRFLQTTLSESNFVEQLKNDLNKSRSKFMTTALETTSCLRLQCDGGEVSESAACVNYPLE